MNQDQLQRVLGTRILAHGGVNGIDEMFAQYDDVYIYEVGMDKSIVIDTCPSASVHDVAPADAYHNKRTCRDHLTDFIPDEWKGKKGSLRIKLSFVPASEMMPGPKP